MLWLLHDKFSPFSTMKYLGGRYTNSIITPQYACVFIKNPPRLFYYLPPCFWWFHFNSFINKHNSAPAIPSPVEEMEISGERMKNLSPFGKQTSKEISLDSPLTPPYSNDFNNFIKSVAVILFYFLGEGVTFRFIM